MKCPKKCQYRKGKEMKTGEFYIGKDCVKQSEPFAWATTEAKFGCRFLGKRGPTKDCPRRMKDLIDRIAAKILLNPSV